MVDDVGVIPGATGQHVDPVIGGDDVIQRIAGTAEIGIACEREVFDVVGQGVIGRGHDRVDAFVGILDNGIGAVVHHIGIIARTANQGIDTAATVEHIVARIAGERVVQGVAVTVQIRRTGQHQILDIVRQGIIDPRLDGINAPVGCLNNAITGIIDHIGVIACATDHRVGAGSAIDAVGGTVAGNRVVQGIAGTVDGLAAGKLEILDIASQGIADRGLDRVVALIRRFDDPVTGIIHHVAIVAGTTGHGIGTAAAIEKVIAPIAEQRVGPVHAEQGAVSVVGPQHVVQAVAGAGERTIPRQVQVLHVVAKGVVDGGLHRIEPFIGHLGHHISGIIDHVGVVAGSTGHGVCSRAAVQAVVTGITGEDVVQGIAAAVDVARTGQGQFLDVVAHGVAGAGEHTVIALIRILDDAVAGAVHEVGVVALTADQGVGTASAVEHIVSGTAFEHIGPAVALEHVVQIVADAIDRRIPGQGQVFHVVGQGVTDTGFHRIDTFPCSLDHRVATVIDHIGVIATAAHQRVSTCPAVERIVPRQAMQGVVAAVALDGVAQFVAGAVNRLAAGEGEVLQVVAQCPGDAALHSIHTFAGRLDNRILRPIHHIGVVAASAYQRVGAGSAIEDVVAFQAVQGVIGIGTDEGVVQGVAGTGDRLAGEGQVLDVVAQGVIEGTDHRIGAFASSLDHAVAGIIQDVGVVAAAARHHVSTGATVEGVAAAVAGDEVVQFVAGPVDSAVAGESEVFQVLPERVGSVRAHRVDAFIGELHHAVPAIVHHIGIVADAADEGVGARAAIEPIIALKAVQGVGATVAFDGVAQFVADTVDIRLAGECEVLDVISQGIRDGGFDRVGPLAGILLNHIPVAFHHVGVVAAAADHRIGPGTAVQTVGAGQSLQGVVGAVAGQGVVQGISRPAHALLAGQGEVL